MDFAWSVAHPFFLNRGDFTGFKDNTLGGRDEVSPWGGIIFYEEGGHLFVIVYFFLSPI